MTWYMNASDWPPPDPIIPFVSKYEVASVVTTTVGFAFGMIYLAWYIFSATVIAVILVDMAEALLGEPRQQEEQE
ncbi:hypothetical protein RRF57_008476 [Xylaria bambusicola]|uniref:Uncharacterized protein n=1 Tax=Xylaria bambusicola TaxID=326684 RepID=A0AAN7Z729_9PEZI